ncbi:MAG: S24 family peptidase [Planctomycetota bacterium]
MVARVFPPLILRRFESIAAGFPSPAQGYEDEPLDLNALLIRRPAATFFFRVQGSALIRDGIRDGSLLVVDRSITPRAGQLVVADVDGVREVCRLPRSAEQLVVWGTVTAIITKV